MPHAQMTRTSRVLAVDDTPDNLFLIEAILGDEGYEVNLSKDGTEALAEIKKSPPDLILLDIMMPGMDGYEVTRRIRQNPTLPYIPILLITAHEQSSVVEGLDAGADDFIRKPFDTDELLARVRSLLRLKHSIDEREAMARQREDFVSRLTHDLRTPLVAADRMLHLFQDETFCPISLDMKEAIEAMIRSNHNLLQMVNTLLEVYRHEAGQKKLTFAPCDLHEIAHEIFQELQPLAQEKGIDLQLVTKLEPNSSGKKEAVVLGDRLELRRVLMNLIGNALKFTDTGTIHVRIYEHSENYVSQVGAKPMSWMVLEVEDTGSGISQEDKANLFKRFRKGKHKRADSGLGLYLSRCIVEGHGGTIQAESELGKGSLFTVRLPM
ncbi:hybrid sensor histidine kinase/response regulator [filamentous cyanobacterium CCP1]|nr:hybrid sensor histidine kinase/response regulator [filamentous cyanobacterium CCP2]PSB67927.1 hybrid sensor histidine kinase/response regulator [filamentous cyanobacterium CCP1]